MKQKKQRPLSEESKTRKAANAIDKKAKTIAKKVKGEVDKNVKPEPATDEAAKRSLISEKSKASKTSEQLLPPTSLIDSKPSAAAEEAPQPLSVKDTPPASAPTEKTTPENPVPDRTDRKSVV